MKGLDRFQTASDQLRLSRLLADTRRVTALITEALDDLKDALPDDVRLHPEMYQQRAFIDLAVSSWAKQVFWFPSALPIDATRSTPLSG